MDPLSVIASTIAIIQATSLTYKAIQHLRGLPNEFKEVSRSLPVAESTLSLIREQLEEEAGDEAEKITIQRFVNGCEVKAKELQNIFEKVEKNKGGSAQGLNRAFLVSLGKGHRVEALMQSILKDLDALARNRIFKLAFRNDMKELKEAITRLSKVEPSMPGSDFDSSSTHFDQRHIASGGIGYRPQGHMDTGSGKQFNVQNVQNMNFVQSPEDDRRRRDILDSLYTVPYLDRKNRNPDRSLGTCEWFINHDQFKQWRESRSSSMLWVSANPGCGKSVLAKYLVDQLKTSEPRITCYFFFKDDFEDQRSAKRALGCILHQLFKQREELFSDKILRRLEACRAQLANSFDDLWDVLLMTAREINAGEIVCILDAFDECEDQERQKLAQTLRGFYDTENNAKDGINLKFLVTSRPYDKVGRGFQPLDIPGLPIIHLKGEGDEEVSKIAKEIDLYIIDRVSRIRESHSLTSSEEQLLLQQLRRIPNQTYLWLYLTFETLEVDIDIDRTRIREIASSLPKNVDEAYEKILNKSINFAKSKKLLHIIVAASRPLTVTELDFALALRPEHRSYSSWERKSEERCGRYIRELCGLFVNITESKVYLLHQTAKEFLVQKEDLQPRKDQDNQLKWKASLRPEESHRILCEICIWHLLLSEFKKFPMSWDLAENVPVYLENYTFLDYSATNWATHFRASDIDDDAVIKLLQQICDVRSTVYLTWFGVYWVKAHGKFPRGFTSLMIASYFGIRCLVKLLLTEKDVKIDATDGHDRRPALSWASENGFDGIVKLLIKRPIFNLFSKSTNVEAKDTYGRTPLSYAAWNGHIATVQRLIKAGARADSKDKIGGTPISYALCTGHEVMANELMKGTQVGSVDEIRQELFCSAVRMGHETIAKRLLKNGANVSAKDKTGDLPLIMAVQLGSKALVQLLLDNGADPNEEGHFDIKPLIMAIEQEDETIARLLLENGADPNEKGTLGMKALVMAIQAKNKDLVKLLLDKNAGFNEENVYDSIALSCAIQMGDKIVAKLLLDRGADPNRKDLSGHTPLAVAIDTADKGMIELLFNNGADANCPTNSLNYGEPLIKAIQQGDDARVKLLLDIGADPNVRGRNGRRALPTAWGKETIIKLLVEKGAVDN